MLSQWRPWAGFETIDLASLRSGWWWPDDPENQGTNYLWCILNESWGEGQPHEG